MWFIWIDYQSNIGSNTTQSPARWRSFAFVFESGCHLYVDSNKISSIWCFLFTQKTHKIHNYKSVKQCNIYVTIRFNTFVTFNIYKTTENKQSKSLYKMHDSRSQKQICFVQFAQTTSHAATLKCYKTITKILLNDCNNFVTFWFCLFLFLSIQKRKKGKKKPQQKNKQNRTK